MKRLVCLFAAFFLALLLFLAPFAKEQGTYAAASRHYSDVNAVINGPTHIAVVMHHTSTFAVPITWKIANTQAPGISYYFSSTVAVKQ
jgi:hypothetical protein